MAYNSTIRQKTGICYLCSDSNKKPLIKNLCSRHYWEQNRLKSVQKAQEKELAEDTGLQTIIDDLDSVFSRYIRMKDADQNGYIACYCCGKEVKWTQADAGHFIPRGHMYTRFSEDNVKPCCQTCNRMKDGNLKAYAEHLERGRPGSVEILREQARIIHHYSRDELKAMIGEFARKIKEMKTYS